MKLSKNYRVHILGYDALVYKDKNTVYVTSLEAGTTQAVSTSDDVVTFQDVADIIADRIASDVSRDISVYSLQGWENLPPDCAHCGL